MNALTILEKTGGKGFSIIHGRFAGCTITAKHGVPLITCNAFRSLGVEERYLLLTYDDLERISAALLAYSR